MQVVFPDRDFLCTNVQESTLTVGGVQEVKVVREHPVLLEHNSEHSQLMFSSAPSSPKNLRDVSAPWRL